ncbi:Putative Mg2+ transporter protein, CorA-like/Zinc transport protein ZntB [Septoria linicola]|uniref:Mg2+ transporter protein, CorA-like/Zinc transport protein ZntB n=1 Tax=Septoria linicola TaxID=215465 RepID=A0A9Q9EMR6_9PEZI|nr:putative Mg2+ transporter protein, CorA-like/Zinc transport protein ZntB [Septoria linicola]USW55754.1 Putative Mg2+ transporter protein, CorA-like/Zinc transport protein ZntB [Septoria linicola]
MGTTWLTSARPQEKDIEAANDSPGTSQGEAEAIDDNEYVPDFSKLRPEQIDRLETWEDAIQPHTDEGGDAYYIGDAYEEINPRCANEWRVSPQDDSAYLQYVKHLAKSLPHLEYLAHWMEVTAAPPKWKFIRKYPAKRADRAKKTKVCVIDYEKGNPPHAQQFDDTDRLLNKLKTSEDQNEEPQVRLLVIEDLSRDLVAGLGEHYDIDPLFFVSHIGDYLFHNTRDRWVELPDLDVDARRKSHFHLQYLRPRYFKTETEFDEAEKESGIFNVLRRLDSDRSRKRLQQGLLDLEGASVTLARAKTSLWVRPQTPGLPKQDGDQATTGAEQEAEAQSGKKVPVAKTKQTILAILLVDPTVTTGHALWGGYRPFGETISMREWQKAPQKLVDAPERKSLYDDVVHWSTRLTDADIDLVLRDSRNIALPMYRLVVAEWLCVLKYMTTMLGKIEWEFEKPHWGEQPSDIDRLLKKLSPWRRNVGYYQTMITQAISRLFPPTLGAQLDPLGDPAAQPTLANPSTPSYNASGILSLWTDFKNIKQQMNETQARIKSIENMATNAINIEEARRAVDQNERAVQQNKNVARLTFLAAIFIPMNFTTSFLSMSPDFSNAKQTIWLFFVLGIPITIAALAIVDLTHPEEKGYCRSWWDKAAALIPRKKLTQSESTPALDRRTDSNRSRTIPWNIRPGATRYDTPLRAVTTKSSTKSAAKKRVVITEHAGK